jgi:hypothetical protein
MNHNLSYLVKNINVKCLKLKRIILFILKKGEIIGCGEYNITRKFKICISPSIFRIVNKEMIMDCKMNGRDNKYIHI